MTPFSLEASVVMSFLSFLVFLSESSLYFLVCLAWGLLVSLSEGKKKKPLDFYFLIFFYIVCSEIYYFLISANFELNGFSFSMPFRLNDRLCIWALYYFKDRSVLQ